MLRLSAEGPILGRLFTDDEETRKERLIVLSYGAWQRRFGGDAAIIGRSVQLDGDPYTIIGVMPKRVPAAVPRGGDLDAARHHPTRRRSTRRAPTS